MNFFITICILALVSYVSRLFQENEADKEMEKIMNRTYNESTEKEEKEMATSKQPDENLESQISPLKPHVMETLIEMGCKTEELDNGRALGVKYQGENFIIVFNEYFMRIWDFNWFSLETDSPKWKLIESLIIESNSMFGPCIVKMDEDAQDGITTISSRFDLTPPVVVSIELQCHIMSMVFDYFFKLHRYFFYEYSKLCNNATDTDPRINMSLYNFDDQQDNE